MFTKTHYLLWLAIAFAMLIVARSQPTTAQDTPICPAEVGCAEITLSPNTLLGDFFLNEQLLAAGQNHVILQVPPRQQHQIVIRNLQSPGEVGFNDLFVYQETTLAVNVRAGQLRQYSPSPRKQFIRGTLNHTCDPRNRLEGEDVSCQIIIDGVDRGVFPTGQAVQFNLDPGVRVVHVQLVGGSMALWEPNAKEENVNITAGRTTNQTLRFDKRAHLIVNLNEEGTVGDFFINDVLMAAQVPFIDLYIAPNTRQNIVVQNIQPPRLGYRWLESTGSTTLSAGREQTLTIRLQSEPLVTTQQAAALDVMQRALDNSLPVYQTVSEYHCMFYFVVSDTGIILRPPELTQMPPQLGSVSQSVLNKYPEYQELYNVVVTLVDESRRLVELWNDRCTRGHEMLDDIDEMSDTEIAAYKATIDAMQADINTAASNVVNAFNDAQNRITILRNPPQ